MTTRSRSSSLCPSDSRSHASRVETNSVSPPSSGIVRADRTEANAGVALKELSVCQSWFALLASAWRSVSPSRARSALTESKGIPKRARVRFNLLAGFGGQRGWRELILWTCGGVGGGGRGGSVLPFGGQDVHGQRRQRCEVVAAPARRRQSGRAEDGRSQALPCGARARLGSGADLREAGSHAARSPPGAGRPRPGGQLLCALAFSAA